ncbi:MAG: response regulator [Deltaproteobacteria bacterium]|nr:response regulator [Deltaproteobacteria bacterium]MBW1796533.1 response regulator [Deltaproteobacteria bacterium]MBW2330798.1 response regulator [Deltaproteobacteria bacterium]
MANILIVDDQQCIRELLAEELMCEGYWVESVGDGESVGEHIRSSRPDLVLLDLYLDGPDGWEVLGDIKRQDPHLPVIIFTAYDSFVDDPRLSQADAYVIKSVCLDELKKKIADVLDRKTARKRKKEVESWHRISKSFFTETAITST